MLESCSFCFSVKWFSHHADHINGLYSQCLDLDQVAFTATISEILTPQPSIYLLHGQELKNFRCKNLSLKFVCIVDSGKGPMILWIFMSVEKIKPSQPQNFNLHINRKQSFSKERTTGFLFSFNQDPIFS